ncbi:hypothetical protein HDU86_003526 [Geranomyces michiganensis]|nr:hypothetical protein HDU86_003526 [Geranomyces michiganensis]
MHANSSYSMPNMDSNSGLCCFNCAEFFPFGRQATDSDLCGRCASGGPASHVCNGCGKAFAQNMEARLCGRCRHVEELRRRPAILTPVHAPHQAAVARGPAVPTPAASPTSEPAAVAQKEWGLLLQKNVSLGIVMRGIHLQAANQLPIFVVQLSSELSAAWDRIPVLTKSTAAGQKLLKAKWDSFAVHNLNFTDAPSVSDVIKFLDALATYRRESRNELEEPEGLRYSSVKTYIHELNIWLPKWYPNVDRKSIQKATRDRLRQLSLARAFRPAIERDAIQEETWRNLLAAYYDLIAAGPSRCQVTIFRNMTMHTMLHTFGVRVSSLCLAHGTSSRGMPEDIISSVEAAAQGKPKVGGLRIRRIALWLETIDEEVTSEKTVFVAGEVNFEFFKTKTRQEDLDSSKFSFPKPKSAEECLGSMLLAWFEFAGDLADNWKEDLAAGRPVPYKDESLDRPVFRLVDRSGGTTVVKPWNEVSVAGINGWFRAAAAQAGYNPAKLSSHGHRKAAAKALTSRHDLGTARRLLHHTNEAITESTYVGNDNRNMAIYGDVASSSSTTDAKRVPGRPLATREMLREIKVGQLPTNDPAGLQTLGTDSDDSDHNGISILFSAHERSLLQSLQKSLDEQHFKRGSHVAGTAELTSLATTVEDALLWIDKLVSMMRRADGLGCPKCGNVLKDKDTYLKHLKRVHGEKDSWPCRDSLRALPHKCTKKFRSKDAERNHYRYAHASECECPVCHGVLVSQDSLTRHLQESHPGWTADASPTSMMVADASSERDPLIAVTDTTVPGTRKQVKTFVCTTCSKVTTTKKAMENHLALHRDEQTVAAEQL